MSKIWNCSTDADGIVDRTDPAPVIQQGSGSGRPGSSDPFGKEDQADKAPVMVVQNRAWSKENQGVEGL